MALVLIDVSKWQGNKLDFGKLAAAGIDGCITKCATGLYGLDPTYKRNWEAIKGHMIRGAYFWHVPEQDPIQQAEAWLKDAEDLESEDLPFTVDFEQVTKIEPKRNLANVLACMRYLRKRTGRKGILYSGRWYWDLCAVEDSPELVAECYYWHAEYPSLRHQNNKGDYAAALENLKSRKPNLSKPWAIRGLHPLLWQFDGDKGLYLPDGTDADFNRFEGTLDDLKRIIEESANGEDLPICAVQDVFERDDIQEELNAQGFDCGKADGIFGPKTKEATKMFQAANGLTADGVIGPKTIGKLNEKRRERLNAAGMCQ